MLENSAKNYPSPSMEGEGDSPVEERQGDEALFPDVPPADPAAPAVSGRRKIFIGVVLSHLLIVAIAAGFGLLYLQTFRGHKLYHWTHGPFNFECGVYRSYAEGRIDLRTTGDNKLSKHLLCAIVYPEIFRRLAGVIPSRDATLVCPFFGGLTLLIFGFWAYWRSGRSRLALPAMLLLGFSFNSWYVSSVCESRAFIMFGAMVLLLALDRLIRQPGLPALLFAALAMVFSALITLGNVYLIPLVPFSLLFRIRRIGGQKFLRWTLLYLLVVGLAVGGTYQILGVKLNPQLKIEKVIELSRHERKSIGAHPGRLTGFNYRNVALQALVYSVGGLYLPCGSRMCDREWVNPQAWRAYFYYPRGVLFAAGYGILILTLLGVFIGKQLWRREPILWVILLWAFLYTSFFVYFNPWAGPVYAAELQPPLWAFIVIVLSRIGSRKTPLLLLLFAAILFWNNLAVMRFFRFYYGDEKQKEEISRSFLPPPPPPVYRPGGV